MKKSEKFGCIKIKGCHGYECEHWLTGGNVFSWGNYHSDRGQGYCRKAETMVIRLKQCPEKGEQQ